MLPAWTAPSYLWSNAGLLLHPPGTGPVKVPVAAWKEKGASPPTPMIGRVYEGARDELSYSFTDVSAASQISRWILPLLV